LLTAFLPGSPGSPSFPVSCRRQAGRSRSVVAHPSKSAKRGAARQLERGERFLDGCVRTLDFLDLPVPKQFPPPVYVRMGTCAIGVDEADDWQKRYYDFNIRNYPQFVEKLRYIHHNPVKAGLCGRPEDWAWSSFRHYATGFEGKRQRSTRLTG
jgi:hypothetical protein